jgi:uncharacterized protein
VSEAIMTTAQPREIYVNLAVAELERSMAFFRKLGFEFNPQYTDDKAACMIINEHAYVMLLRREFFATFTKRALCDAREQTEVLLAFSCESRARVDELVRLAIEGGGSRPMDPVDHGFMYYSTFCDLDGHHWEVMWMDPSAEPPAS